MSPRTARPARPLLGLALGLLAACQVEASSEPTGTGPEALHASAVRERQATKVRTATVERRTMQRLLETTAAVESLAEVQVVAEASGRAVEVLAQEGQRVLAGDVLARLDDRDQTIALADAAVAEAEALAAVERAGIAEQEAQAMVRTAELALEQAERDHARNVNLAEGQQTSSLSKQALEASGLARDRAKEELAQAHLAASRSEVDTRTAKAAHERATLAHERAERDLERTTLLAPIPGVVAMRDIEPGRNVTMGQAAFELVDLDRLRVIFYRPQRELDLFRGGDVSTLTATTEAAPDFTFTGRLERVSPTVDRTSGAFRVTAHLDPVSRPDDAGETARLLPGLLLRLAVVTGTHPDTLVVPKRAVRREGSGVFVLAVEDGEDGAAARRVAVTEGFADAESVEVLPLFAGALAEGARVITVGGRELEDGDAVMDEGAEDAPGTTAATQDVEAPADTPVDGPTADETPTEGTDATAGTPEDA